MSKKNNNVKAPLHNGGINGTINSILQRWLSSLPAFNPNEKYSLFLITNGTCNQYKKTSNSPSLINPKTKRIDFRFYCRTYFAGTPTPLASASSLDTLMPPVSLSCLVRQHLYCIVENSKLADDCSTASLALHDVSRRTDSRRGHFSPHVIDILANTPS